MTMQALKMKQYVSDPYLKAACSVIPCDGVVSVRLPSLPAYLFLSLFLSNITVPGVELSVCCSTALESFNRHAQNDTRIHTSHLLRRPTSFRCTVNLPSPYIWEGE